MFLETNSLGLNNGILQTSAKGTSSAAGDSGLGYR